MRLRVTETVIFYGHGDGHRHECGGHRGAIVGLSWDSCGTDVGLSWSLQHSTRGSTRYIACKVWVRGRKGFRIRVKVKVRVRAKFTVRVSFGLGHGYGYGYQVRAAARHTKAGHMARFSRD